MIEKIRDEGRHYYHGDLELRIIERLDGTRISADEAELVWTAYEGGSATIRLDVDELERLAAACSKLRAAILEAAPWLAS